jgi:NADH-quinone oxidoreductase subunit C
VSVTRPDVERGVLAHEWIDAVRTAADGGHGYLDLFAGVDRETGVEVVVRLLDPDHPVRAAVRLVTQVEAGTSLRSLTPVLPAADWHERELAEMFGVRIDGHPGLRPLVRRQPAGAPPLLRSTVLPARMARPWPGAADAGEEPRSSRRRQAPPGVVPGWLDEEPR